MASLKQVFQEAVTFCGGELVFPQSQKTDLEKEWANVSSHKRGVCLGLCLLHSAYSKTLGGKFKGGGKKGRKATMMFADKLQQISTLYDHQSFFEMSKFYMEQCKNWSLKFKGGSKLKCTFGYIDKIAEFVKAREGFHQIQMPNHVVMAMHVDNAYSYYDPNAGEARFMHPDILKRFMVKYHNSAEFKEAYKAEYGLAQNDLFVFRLE